MILPNKYISMPESLIGISSLILDALCDKEMTVDELWNGFCQCAKKNKKMKNIPTYNKFVLSLNLMYLTGMIEYKDNGVIFNENIKHEDI